MIERVSSRVVLTTQLLLLAMVVLSFSGCQSSEDRVYPVGGKVVFADGSPAQFGIIEFRSDAPTPVTARGKIKKDGSFRVRATGRSWGLTKGTHKCIVLQVIGNPRGQPRLIHSHGLDVADKYRDYKTSDLEVVVTPKGDNQFEILVDSK